jgi:hypothetical protein
VLQLILTKADKMKPQELRVVVGEVETAARSKRMNMAAPWVVVRVDRHCMMPLKDALQATSAQVGDYGIGDLRANICEAAGASLDDTRVVVTDQQQT